jgi:hypothetical protein
MTDTEKFSETFDFCSTFKRLVAREKILTLQAKLRGTDAITDIP